RDRRRRARLLDNTGARRATATPTSSEDPSRGARDSKKSLSLIRQGDRTDPIAVIRFVEREQTCHPIASMCRLLVFSTTACYSCRQRVPSRHHNGDEMLKEHIMRIHRLSRGTYGAPRIHAELRDVHNIRCGKKRVARLMRELGIEGV